MKVDILLKMAKEAKEAKEAKGKQQVGAQRRSRPVRVAGEQGAESFY